jgi:hypothetical protein
VVPPLVALRHLQQLDATKLVGKGGGPKPALMGGAGAAGGFVSQWLGVGDMVRAHVALERATRDKARRKELRELISSLDGRLSLIKELMSSCSAWPALCVPGTDISIDREWNVGLVGPASEKEACDELPPEQALATGRVC